MKINQAGIDLIKKYEGCVLKVYIDAAGVKTCGYGHTGADVNLMTINAPITQQMADTYLMIDIGKAEKQVDKYVSKYNFTENEYSALCSFAYNIGSIDQLTAKGTRTKNEIADKIPLYNKAAGKVLTGLVRRRNDERNLFLKGGNVSDLNTKPLDDNDYRTYPLLKKGSTGAYVTKAETILKDRGYYHGNIDIYFGPLLEQAVISWQGGHYDLDGIQLQKDGKIGPKTWWSLLQ